jgi:hypothetical protein
MLSTNHIVLASDPSRVLYVLGDYKHIDYEMWSPIILHHYTKRGSDSQAQKWIYRDDEEEKEGKDGPRFTFRMRLNLYPKKIISLNCGNSTESAIETGSDIYVTTKTRCENSHQQWQFKFVD